LGAIGETRNFNRELIFDEHAIEFEARPVGGIFTAATHPSGDFAGIFEPCYGETIIDQTSWGTETEEEGIRSPVNIDALRIVGVERNVGFEEIPGAIWRSQTTNTGSSIRITTSTTGAYFTRATFISSGEITENTGDFRTGGVLEEFFNARGTDIVHEVLGDHLNGGTGVFQGLVETSASQSLGGDVTFVLGCIDDEWREIDDFFGVDLVLGGLGGHKGRWQ
jgi:hypothetical protein